MGKNESREGIDCQRQQDGSLQCQRIEINDQGEKVSTGTEFGISANQSTGCKPAFSGDISIMDGDEKKVNAIVKKVVLSCKRGL